MKIHSFIGERTTIKGNLQCTEDFLIEGAVEGNLRSNGAIILGKDAAIRGEVVAREVAIAGSVVGTVKCSERLEILQSAEVAGTVQAPSLKLEAGARVNAQIIMTEQPAESRLTPQNKDEARTSNLGSRI